LRKKLNLHTWNRKEHFEFFSQFDEPFFGIVSEVDMSQCLQRVEAQGGSLYATYLHLSLVAVNSIAEFRFRKEGNEVFIYDEIHASATIGRADGTFAFSFIPFHSDSEIFCRRLKEEISLVQSSKGIRLDSSSSRNDVIHYSSLPWNRFTDLTHARNF